MSDDKPEKLFYDKETGILHGSACPKTKKEFHEEGGSDDCKFEKALDDLREQARIGLQKKDMGAALREAIPYEPDDDRQRRCGSSGHAHGGPAQVASKAYRDGHDRIFGTKPTVGKA